MKRRLPKRCHLSLKLRMPRFSGMYMFALLVMAVTTAGDPVMAVTTAGCCDKGVLSACMSAGS